MSTTPTDSKKMKHISKKLSWILRHGAKEIGLNMTEDGWVYISDLLKHISLDLTQLQDLVQQDRKQRFEIIWKENPIMRASQGHSHTLVKNLDTLEQSWDVYTTDDKLLWHGTYGKAVEEIAQQGIKALSRTHVHLAEELDSVVGKRANVTFMLGIDPKLLRAFHPIYRSPNGVILTRYVPASCIVALQARSKKAHKQRSSFVHLFPNLAK